MRRKGKTSSAACSSRASGYGTKPSSWHTRNLSDGFSKVLTATSAIGYEQERVYIGFKAKPEVESPRCSDFFQGTMKLDLI